MIWMIFILTWVFVDRETLRDSMKGNTDHWKRFFIRLYIPILIGALSGWLHAALSFSLFYIIFDPLLNYRRGKPLFDTHPGTWKQVLSGEKSFYDIIPGKVAFIIELIIFIVLLWYNFQF